MRSLLALCCVVLTACTVGGHVRGAIAPDSVQTYASTHTDSVKTWFTRLRVDTVRKFDTTFDTVTTVDTVSVTDTIWAGLPSVLRGTGFGLTTLWGVNTLASGPWTLAYGQTSAANVSNQIAYVQAHGLLLVTTMTGGARANYLTNGVFDMAKWQAVMAGYNTQPIRDGVAAATAIGMLLGNTVIDEPFNVGGTGNEANGWGPKGTLNKARVDSMCAMQKTILPTLPAGVFHDPDDFDPTHSYKVCDFITAQYRYTAAKGPLLVFRDSALAMTRREGIAVGFAINVIDGGTQAARKRADGTVKIDYDPGDCPLTTTGGRGSYFPNCRMTAAQIRESGLALGTAGCYLTGFRYDSVFAARPANQQAFRDVADSLARLPAKSCKRS